MLTSRTGSHFECSNISFNKSKFDSVISSSNVLNSSIRKSGRSKCENFYGFLQTVYVAHDIYLTTCKIHSAPGQGQCFDSIFEPSYGRHQIIIPEIDAQVGLKPTTFDLLVRCSAIDIHVTTCKLQGTPGITCPIKNEIPSLAAPIGLVATVSKQQTRTPKVMGSNLI